MADIKKVLLHIGCADRYYEGFINSDIRLEWKGRLHKLDLVMDISKKWPYEDESIDGIIGMHILQQLLWRDLVIALREAYRVLKDKGVLRVGVPAIEKGKSLEYLLGWNNINLFSYGLLSKVLKKIGFIDIREAKYKESVVLEFTQVDNRPEQTMYIEAIK